MVIGICLEGCSLILILHPILNYVNSIHKQLDEFDDLLQFPMFNEQNRKYITYDESTKMYDWITALSSQIRELRIKHELLLSLDYEQKLKDILDVKFGLILFFSGLALILLANILQWIK